MWWFKIAILSETARRSQSQVVRLPSKPLSRTAAGTISRSALSTSECEVLGVSPPGVHHGSQLTAAASLRITASSEVSLALA
eukprot:5179257-Prymnesium_polylepis.1